jgi:hypothetical protein
MDFEQLIEEKLKIADQLDMEQARLKRNKPRSRQMHDESNYNSNESSNNNEQSYDGGDYYSNGDEMHHEGDVENDEAGMNVPRQPKKFLKKGEGLKKYMPKPRPKKNVNASSKQNGKTNATAPLRSVSTNCIRATSSSATRLSTGSNKNNTASSASNRKSSVGAPASRPPSSTANTKTNVKSNATQAKPAPNAAKPSANLISSASCTNLTATSSKNLY